MHGAHSGTLLFYSDIDKTILKAIREATIAPLPSLSDFSSDEEMGEPERITLWNYKRLDNIDEVTQGFQPVNPVHFDIKH